jgi:hypothetical protein
VVERQVPDDSVPLARESDCELLGDIERSVGVNGEQRIKVAEANFAILRARVTGERAGKRADEEEWATASPHDTRETGSGKRETGNGKRVTGNG